MGAVNSIVTGIKNYSKKDGNKNIVLLAVYLIIQTSVFAMLTPFFITAANFQNLMRQTAELGMVTIPLAIILMTGNIDLSIGSVMGVCAISLARLLKTGMNIWLAVLITILIGAAIGSLNGFLVARMHLAGIVATLGLIFPSIVIIGIIAAFLKNFADLAVVQHAFAGIRVCVGVLILNAVLKLWKGAVKGKITAAIVVLSCAVSAFTDVSSVAMVVAAGVLGFLFAGKIEKAESGKKSSEKGAEK